MAYNRTLQHFTSPQELATLWATGRDYLLNQVVIQDNKLYRCLVNHTSGTFQTDYANSNWVELSSGMVPWVTAVYYTANQFVEENDKIYRCLVSHTSTTFSADIGAGKWVEISAGSGSGTKNYITNGDFEQNTDTGWSLASSTLDATTKLPNQVSASWTAASGSLSKSVISSGQLAGSYSLQLSSTAATTAGNMLVTDALALDLEAQATIQTFSFFYKVTSNGTGTPNFSGTSSNAIGVAIYDATNNQWIQPAGVFNLVQLSGVGQSSGSFQVPSNCTSVRLAVYFPNSTAASGGSPFTVVFDDFQLGPQKVLAGAAISDWQSYTPTFTGLGTVSSLNAKWRRVGDSINVAFTVGAGTTTAALASMSLPFAIDTTKAINNSIVGQATAAQAPFPVSIMIGTSSPSVVFLVSEAAGNYFNATPGNTWASLTTFGGEFSYPAAGLSSNTVMSQDTDTRVVAFNVVSSAGTGTITASFGTSTAFIPSTVTSLKDSHSAWNASTGIYTVPVSGTYRISGGIKVEGTHAAGGQSYYYWLGLFKNASAPATQQITSNQTAATNPFQKEIPFSFEVACVAGDQLYIKVASSIPSPVYSAISDGQVLSISRLSGPATIAASESVQAKFYASVGGTCNTTTPINFDSKVFDSHGAVTTGASWKFTAPISGKYLVTTFINASVVPAGNVYLRIYTNGGAPESFDYILTTQGTASASEIMSLNAGDYIDIRTNANFPWYGSAITNSASLISIARIGN